MAAGFRSSERFGCLAGGNDPDGGRACEKHINQSVVRVIKYGLSSGIEDLDEATYHFPMYLGNENGLISRSERPDIL